MSDSNSSVLVTGAFGNLGQRVLKELKARGHRVVAMDLDTRANRKGARRATGNFDEVRWEDIRQVDWPTVLRGQRAVIHLAAVLPPVTERAPALAEAVNLDASLRLIDALERQAQPAQLVFPSSVTVFGYPTGKELKRVEDKTRPSDNYTRHKVAVELQLARSTIPWSVLRIGVSIDGNIPKTETEMTKRLFATAPDNPVEYVHPADVALAAVNALNNPEALGRVWLIGGGPSCRVTQYDLLSAPLAAMGVDLPIDMFGNGQFYTHWMDTEESERVLRFQRHSFVDFRLELSETIGKWRILAHPLAPLIRWGLRRSLRAG
jgi:nucleoside-diphosphate-sugar epimerase